MSTDYLHRTLRVGGIETHYLEAGEGPDLVLLHGGEYGASAEATWGTAIAKLGRTFHVLAPDMLGYGRTAKIYSFSDPSGFRLTHLAQWLEVVGVGEAFFVGNSAGGGTLLRSSVRNPSPLKMKKMVTICGNAGVFKSDFQADLEDYTPSLENMGKLLKLLFHDEKWLTQECVESRYNDSIAPGAWEALSAARLKRPGYERGSTIDAFVKQLSTVTVPLLIIGCDHDPLNQPDWDDRLQRIVPGSTTHRFHDSAHEPQIEEQDAFVDVVTGFLLS
ncbi:MAG: alpha/beta hydrolase [Deltaproteobacteria bacterium]|nr:alpha/beta hydrolase [Deltaproteobacteria bacterium]